METLTRRQAEILEMIRTWIDEQGAPPTRAEISRSFGFRSPNAAESHLRALARKGAIELQGGTSRGIRLPRTASNPVGLPLVGRVAAGEPVLAIEHLEEYYPLEADFFKPAADYLLRVQGMSMRDAGMLDGDLLAVHSTSEASNGQIVVARLDGEVTVKRFSRQGDRVTLQPENSDYSPIQVDLSRQKLTIEGLGVGLIRHGMAFPA